MVNLSRHSKRVRHNTELHCINSSEQKWSCRDSALTADKMLKTWIIFLINISPSFVVPYPHRSVQTTSRNQWFSYAHIHTSDDTTMECLRQQLKCCYITLSVNNINITQRPCTSTYCTYHNKGSEEAMKKQRWPNRNFWYVWRFADGSIVCISGEFGQVMVCILARHSQVQIPLARPNNPGWRYIRQDWSSHGLYFGEMQSSPNSHMWQDQTSLICWQSIPGIYCTQIWP